MTMLDATQLPQPDGDAQRASGLLTDRIRNYIVDSDGRIGFDEFMHMALYEPGLGYYTGGAVKFGIDGDFVTAPEISSMFGASVARQCREVLAQTDGDIFEFGAGEGHLAANLIAELVKLNALPKSYKILELNPLMRDRQRRLLEDLVPEQLPRVEWLTELPICTISGVILANEIVDALPVKLFCIRSGSVFERHVCINNNRFAWLDLPANDVLTAQVVARVGNSIVDSGDAYLSEINVGLEPWISDLSRILRDGLALIFDYGHARSEYYRSDRTNGTLQCHFRHRAHDDPFWFPGLQDITTSVDFTAVAEAADAAGLHVAGFVQQANFLIACDLLSHAEERAQGANVKELARLAYETKVLTLPTEMGTRFKVLALTKGYNHALRGFQNRDDRHRL